MSTINGKPYSSPRNINLKGGILRFGALNSTNPIDSSSYGLYVNGSGNLIFSSSGSTTTIGATGGGGATPSWETLFGADATFTITPDTTFTIAGNRSTATDVVTLTNIGGGSGNVIQITNSGTGKDINGTSNTWSVTKAGVAVFAGVSISGTSTAMTYTGAAVMTLLDNSATSLSIGSTGATSMLVFDTTDGAETLKTSATVFQVTSGKTNLIQASNTVSTLVLTDNVVTTFGANANSAGVMVIRSTSLTTGALLQLQVTEGTLAGGFFIVGRHVTAGSNVYTVGENGATVIAGLEGSDMLTLTVGDVNIGTGSITMVDNDNAATFSVTNNTATSASVFVYAGSGVFTGTTTTSFMTLTPSGLTTGTALYIAAAGATTSVGVVDIAVAGLTTGSALRITSATANFTTGAKLIELTSTAAVAGNHLTATTTGAYTGTGMILVTAGAATTGVLVSVISTTGLTSGSLIRATTSTAGALITNGAISFTATGNYTSNAVTDGGFVEVKANSTVAGTIMNITGTALTTGVALVVSNSTSGMTTGSLIRATASGTGTIATNGIVSIRHGGIFVSTANAGVLDVQASALVGAGTIVNIKSTADSQTAANLLNVAQSGSTLTAYTGSLATFTGGFSGASSTGSIMLITAVSDVAGDGLKIVNNALTLGAGTLINLSHTTSVIGAGSSMLRITSTGVDTGTTTGTMIDLAATAATTAHLMIITSATLTTGQGIKMTLNGLTSGSGMSIISSSADTTARGLIQLTSSSTSATGTSAIRTTMALMSTHFRKIMTDSGAGITLWYGDGTTGQGNLTGTAGDVLLNGGSNKPEYCTGTTNWTALV